MELNYTSNKINSTINVLRTHDRFWGIPSAISFSEYICLQTVDAIMPEICYTDLGVEKMYERIFFLNVLTI